VKVEINILGEGIRTFVSDFSILIRTPVTAIHLVSTCDGGSLGAYEDISDYGGYSVSQ
jgi:hypothetical protein